MEKITNIKNDDGIESHHKIEQSENPFRFLKKEFADLESIFMELGLWSFQVAYKTLFKSLPARMLLFKKFLSTEFVDTLVASLECSFDLLLSQLITDSETTEDVLANSSDKVNCLVNIFKDAHMNYSKHSSDEASISRFHSIIFVARKKTASYLNNIFSLLSRNEEFYFLKSDFVYGTTQTNAEENMNVIRQVNIDKFLLQVKWLSLIL